MLETSLPGVFFAAGDVRSGSIKRVASAVGEGSIAIAFVHQALRELGVYRGSPYIQAGVALRGCALLSQGLSLLPPCSAADMPLAQV
jgi:hypothetical protein